MRNYSRSSETGSPVPDPPPGTAKVRVSGFGLRIAPRLAFLASLLETLPCRLAFFVSQ